MCERSFREAPVWDERVGSNKDNVCQSQASENVVFRIWPQEEFKEDSRCAVVIVERRIDMSRRS